jgi:rifampicin phosphotransferase
MTRAVKLWARAQDKPTVALVGGKAASLARLQDLALSVPNWFCVTTDFYQSRIATALGAQLQLLLTDLVPGEDCEQRSEQARQLIMNWQWPEADRALLLAQFDQSFEDEVFVSVRSSAPVEDAQSASFAGQFDSFLYVRREAIPEAIKKCWASLFSARSLNYRAFKGLHGYGASMAVLVQEMVASQAAGVLFTRSPDDPDSMLLTAGLGLGEGIVSDKVEADSFRLDRRSGALAEQTPVLKTCRMVAGESGGVILETGLNDEAPCLSEEQVVDLGRFGKVLEEQSGAPVDMEWALDKAGELFVLQARPITNQGRPTLFDNSNIVESYPGLTLPLTFSCVRVFYATLFSRAGLAFGVPPSIVAAHRRMYESLVGLIEGRVYYNLPNWYGLYTLIPGYEGNTPAWERMIGLQPGGGADGETSSIKKKDWKLRLRYLPVMIWLVMNVVWRFIFLARDVKHLTDYAQRTCGDYDQLLQRRHDAHELLEDYDALVETLVHRFEITVINDFFVMTFFDQLTKALAQLKIENPQGLANDLLCGSRHMASVEPVEALLKWAQNLDEKARDIILNSEPSEALSELESQPCGALFREQLGAYLKDYGHRQLEELKLETPSLHSNAEFLVGTIKESLETGLTMAQFDQKDGDRRSEAEGVLDRAMKKRGVFFRRWWIGYVLERARQTVRYRENLRLARARGFGVLRLLFERLGVIFEREGVLVGARDVFYLTRDEVFGLVLGTCETRDLKGLVELRRGGYEDFAKAQDIEERIIVSGLAGLAKSGRDHLDLATSTRVLRGTGCSAGIVSARARVIRDPRSAGSIDGAILVAKMTDPGWVFLMIRAAGLIVEKGSLLSHTAIIGRELGIPTIVGVRDGTALIEDGVMIEMDGREGVVRVIDEGEKEVNHAAEGEGSALA